VVAVPIIAAIETPVAAHEVVRVALDTGAVIEVSAGHPAGDGRRVGDLRAGDEIDGVRVVATERVPYAGARTHDILPASRTGTYFAGGLLLRSTLNP
jgi:hypothetical protein